MPLNRARLGVSYISVLLVASACASRPAPPPGTDGSLTNQWPGHSAPVQWEPEAGTCHASFELNLRRSAYEPIDCESQHRFESVHVGQFSGVAARRTAPPAVDSPELRAAWAACDAKTTAYLGGQWRDRQLWIGVSAPSQAGWQAGARWYLCQVGAAQWVGNPRIVFARSIRGGFATQDELEWGCGHQPDDGEYEVRHCDEPHNAEFAGSFPLDLSYAEAEARFGRNDPLFHRGCLKVIARFVGVASERHLPSRTASVYRIPGQEDWEAGDRAVRCHLWVGSRLVSRSLRGVGARGLSTGTP